MIFFPSYSSQQSVHRNCSDNPAVPRAVSIIWSIHCLSIHSCSAHGISEARDTCTTPPSSDAAVAIKVQRTPYNTPEKDEAVRLSVLVNRVDDF